MSVLIDLNNMFVSETTYHLLVFTLLFPFFATAQGTSIRDQSYLIDQEPILINVLQKYIEAENVRLEHLQKFRDTLTEHVDFLANDDGDLAWNPLSIYKTVKYLISDFDVVKNSMMKNSYNDTVPKMIEEGTTVLPDENHLYEAIRDFVLAQEAQSLRAQDVMNNATDLTNNLTLTLEDCFYIGHTLSEKHHHKMAVEWLLCCESKFDKTTLDRAHKAILYSALFLGDKMLCRYVLNKCLRDDHTNRKFADLNMKLSLQIGNFNHQGEEDQWHSFKICAGDYDNEPKKHPLKCRYNHHNSPFLTIAPLKEEMVSFEPKVSIFREAIYDSEIEQLLADSQDHFHTAGVVKPNNSRRPDLNYRPSQTCFVSNTGPQYASLWNRLEDLSSLSLRRSESFQMLHYAPGGFYRVHPDFLGETLPEVVGEKGNRISTALMYLNTVPSGGNTVFPRLKLNVHPVKGSILFWMNMRVDKTEETNTRHAACPVIYGEKFACTQWYRMGGQDHWIAQPEEDAHVHYSINPNILCHQKQYLRVNATARTL